MKRKPFLYFTIAMVCFWGTSQPCPAVQEDSATTLEKAELEALKQINEKRVRATISFLASDELGGRDTPSPGLDVASAYVAARFQGAGLEPLGNKKFYQTTMIDTIEYPDQSQVIAGDAVIQPLGILGAAEEDFQWTGKLTLVSEDTPDETEFDGPVLMMAPSVMGRREAFQFQATLKKLIDRGATAVLIQVEQDHPLIRQAPQAGKPMLSRRRISLNVPTLLIPKQELSDKISIRVGRLKKGKAEVKNVIGVLKGSDPELSKEAIIVSAHLDHIGQFEGKGDTINNGADDDATGVTAVLSLADAFAALPEAPKRSIVFMTFWGEEKGLLGSKHYVESPTWPLASTVANVNLEMLGRPESGAAGKVWMTGWKKSDLGELMAVGAERVNVRVFEHPRFSPMLYGSSDNYSFAKKGVIAHSFSAGSLHNDYHQPTDEWQKLRLDHMTKVIQGIFAGILPIAQGEVTPKK